MFGVRNSERASTSVSVMAMPPFLRTPTASSPLQMACMEAIGTPDRKASTPRMKSRLS